MITTDMVLRYVKHMYGVELDQIRTARPMVDRPWFKVETIAGVTYEIPEVWIAAREGVA